MPLDPATASLLLQRFPVLTQAPAELLEQAIAESEVRKVGAGDVLFDRHMPCAGFPLVLEGTVRVSTVSPAGREIVLYRVTPGGSLRRRARVAARTGPAPNRQLTCIRRTPNGWGGSPERPRFGLGKL